MDFFLIKKFEVVFWIFELVYFNDEVNLFYFK